MSVYVSHHLFPVSCPVSVRICCALCMSLCLHPAGTKDMKAHGKVWAVLKGPYGRTLALCWDDKKGKETRLVDVGNRAVHWTLPNSTNLWPHDMALGAAALPLTGAGDRMLALYVAPLCESCGVLEKYVLVPPDFGAPASEQATQPMVLKPGQRPPLAHLGGHHAHNHGSGHEAAAAAATPPQQPQQQQQAKEVEAEALSEEEKQEDAKEQQAEQKVVEEEAKEDEKEVQQLHDPQVLAELKQQLAQLQEKIAKVSGEAGGSDNEAYAVFHTKRHTSSEQGGAAGFLGSWGATVLWVLLSMLAGGLTVFAYFKLKGARHQQPAAAAAGQQPVGNGVAYAQSCAVDEEAEVVGDTGRLLGNGVVRR